MTLEEIFSNINKHMSKGLMIHDQIANAFSFLNLRGYRKCHEYHYYEESINYRELNNFYLKYFQKLIPTQEIENPEIIPSSWHRYMREDVDINTKRQQVRELFKKWIDWENETKTLLQSSYKELDSMGEDFAAEKIMYFLKDVSNELAIAQEKYINLKSIDYDIVSIVEEQDILYEKYKEKIKQLHKKEE